MIADETLAILRAIRKDHDAILVSYSDGKDSRVLIDLCLRTFARVEAFFMSFLPGLECEEIAIATAEKRWGVQIRRYPHWVTAAAMRTGAYGFDPISRNVPRLDLGGIRTLAMFETNTHACVTGAKKTDSTWRRRTMKSERSGNVWYPLIGWGKYDVLAYLKSRGIPVPNSSERNATGIDLSTPSLLWLNENFPNDFKRICEFFPFAEAVIWRKRFYNIPA